MSGDATIVGSTFCDIYPATDSVYLSASEIDNQSLLYSTGTIRLELWLTTSPWNTSGSNNGYEVATYQISGSSNGTLGPYQYFSNVSATVPYINHPPAGTYYVTLAVAEYTGASPSVDNGFLIDSATTFPSLLVVDNFGNVTQGGPSTPTYTLTPSSYSMNEGATDNVTLQTSNVTPGTSISYTISGILPGRLSSDSLSGTVTIGTNGQAIIPLSVINDLFTDGPTTVTITVGNSLASTSIQVNDTSLTPTLVIPTTFKSTVGSVIASPGQSLDLSSIFNLPAGANNPTYLDVTLLDRSEYPYGVNHTLGSFEGNGLIVPDAQKLEASYFFGVSQTDSYDTGVIFTYQQSTGRYYNSTYGYFDQLKYITSPNQYDNTEISIFATNSSGLISNVLGVPPSNYFMDPETLGPLSSAYGIGLVGNVDVITRSDISGPAPSQATPNSIISAAQSFIGKVWNDEGCWVLACNISSMAGASLPITTPGGAALLFTGENTSKPVSNGEWIVAYFGGDQSSPSISSAESVIRAGDIVVMEGPNGGHITTVVSGSGANAMTIDNAQTGNNYVDSQDITIGENLTIGQEFSTINAIPSEITVYRLDTPTINISSQAESTTAGSSISLSGAFSAVDAGGAGSLPITEYAVYDVGSGNQSSNSFSVNGVSETAHSSGANAIVLPATTLGSLKLQTAPGQGGTDTVYISAYNGSYWGDWTNLAVQVNQSAITTINLTTPNSTINSTSANEQITGTLGINTVNYSGPFANYTITQSGSEFVVHDNTGVDGTDTLSNIQRLHFSDCSVALDVIGGNAGFTAELLGAIFGQTAVSNSTYAGIGLHLLDGGTSLQNLSLLALNVRLGAGFSNTQEVQLLYQNLFGSTPSQAEITNWDNVISSGTLSQAGLAVAAAESNVNNTNINLTGIAAHGLTYLAV